MSGIRDQILATPVDLKEEPVVIPEWNDVKLIVRELTSRDRNDFLASMSELQEDADGDYHSVPVKDPLRQARLVILSTFEESGERVFQDDDAEWLGGRGASALDRISKVASKLSGLGGNAAAVGKDSEPTGDGDAPTS